MLIEREAKAGFKRGDAKIGVMPLEGHLGFGLMPAMSTTFGSLEDYIADDPFKAGDRLLAVNGQKIRHHWDIRSIEAGLNGRQGDDHDSAGAQKRSMSGFSRHFASKRTCFS